MRILILGAGKMGSFFTDVLSFDHECAVYETDAKRMRFLYNTRRFTNIQEIDSFKPELVINAVTLKYTLEVFDQILPHLPKDCIISDISSVKTGFKEFYDSTGFRYVSTHPMFGPTFANLGALSSENAIVINEGDYMGRIFFLDLYRRLGLNVHEYTFEEHDEAMAYSLSVPFVSTFVFSAVMKHQDSPGTTFKRHLKIARGVLSEDDTLLREILFNPKTKSHVEQIRAELKELIQIIDDRDEEALNNYLVKIRKNIQ
jgi:prephenate dehydrogenase